MMSRVEHLEQEARRWEAAAERSEAAGDRGGAQFARDQAAVIRAQARERAFRMQQIRGGAVRFG